MYMSHAQVHPDSGDDAAGSALVDQANAALDNADIVNALTDYIQNGKLDSAPLCEPVIDAGRSSFRLSRSTSRDPVNALYRSDTASACRTATWLDDNDSSVPVGVRVVS
jgi:hypothetical protein